MRLALNAYGEDRPGARWAEFFAERWPVYRRWWLSQGEAARPTYLACERAMARHMPELFPLWQRLIGLAGGSDLAARFLSGYRPPAYVTGCSQAVWLRDEPVLVRNYDYFPGAWEGALWHTRWQGNTVLGMSDCLWGLLDGINESGLAVSLAFGGRQRAGDGFGIPVILRYVLQTCATVAEAQAALCRVPCHMSYTVTVLDPTGAYSTLFLGPDLPTRASIRRVATNHQGEVHWNAHAMATASVERLKVLTAHLHRPTETSDRFASRFLEPPTWSDPRGVNGGTLYTAVYRPVSRTMELRWPGRTWAHSIDGFEESRVLVNVPRSTGLRPTS